MGQLLDEVSGSGVLSPAAQHVATHSGRSRGGLTAKLHLAVDGLGRSLAPVLTGGNVDGCTQFVAVGWKAIHALLRRRGIGRTTSERDDQIGDRLWRGGLGGRPVAFDREPRRAL
ncbi:hypothetical protein [Kitasatospora aureofaciens]|uniref:hypothetical protein n=1 Tax=Kitasatospora aureofaciens TaxID=1894 RepID=UPI003F4D4B6E